MFNIQYWCLLYWHEKTYIYIAKTVDNGEHTVYGSVTWRPKKCVFKKTLKCRHKSYLLLFYSLSTLWKYILFLDILLESDFIQQFVVLVPKIVIWCDMKIIVHKMKMEYIFLKLLTLSKSFIITNQWSTIVFWKLIISVYFFHNRHSVWGPCSWSYNIF